MVTNAPSVSASRAVSRPIPELPPMMTTSFPSSLISKSSPIVRNEFNYRPVLHFTAIHPPLPTSLPTPDSGDIKFNSRLVAPTRLDVMRFNDDLTDVPLAVTTNRPLSRNLI